MAFNLNKNDGPEGASAPNVKFDLSKNIAPASGIVGNRKKSNVLSYLVIGLLLVAGGAWYLFSNRSSPIEKSDYFNSTLKMLDTSSAVAPSPEVTDEGEKVVNKIPVRFARGASSFSTLDQSIVSDILAHLAGNSAAKLDVLGYASSEGSVAINQSISQARADAFKKYLISKDVVGSRITAIGKGIEDPIASNDTESGRRKNRRVEVRLN